MPFLQPDLILQDTLRQTFQDTREDSSLVDDVLSFRPQREREALKDFFATKPVSVELGYPRDTTQVPGVFVVLGRSGEDREPIGARIYEEEDAAGFTEYEGTYFKSTVNCEVWSLNAQLTVWLQNVTVWGLMRSRTILSECGFLEQSLTCSDLEPVPRFFPDFVYRRVCSFSARHLATFAIRWPKVRTIGATITSSGDSEIAIIPVGD